MVAAPRYVGRAVRQINRLLFQTPSGEGYAHLALVSDLARGDLSPWSADVYDRNNEDIGIVTLVNNRWIDITIRGARYRMRRDHVDALVRARELEAPIRPHPSDSDRGMSTFRPPGRKVGTVGGTRQ